MTRTEADLTPREVAELAGVPKRAIEKAIEEKVLPVHTGKIPALRSGKAMGTRRFLGVESVAYATLVRRLTSDVTLTIAGKRKLIKALKSHELSRLKTAQVEIAPSVTADIGELAGEALERTDRYLRARETWIDSVPGIKGGLPVIKGTRLTVHSIEARVEHGDSMDDIVAENPDLPREALEAALLFARSHPLSGRPQNVSRRPAA
ncbi:DUF433 domain-containing protein [Methylosinus sp. PW1]|uniref:DUF433 domain-containing protein n=1 Tax=Methylosinus sp. PW1 TaxID=107636 RepID=UPI00068D2722|nr:DUF433 domain-containing protein [Methylosinus sp. PW1]